MKKSFAGLAMLAVLCAVIFLGGKPASLGNPVEAVTISGGTFVGGQKKEAQPDEERVGALVMWQDRAAKPDGSGAEKGQESRRTGFAVSPTPQAEETTDAATGAEEPAEEAAAMHDPLAAAPYTQADLDLLSRIIYAEAGCTWIPDEVQMMVGSVVLNRVESAYYPDTIYDVIYQEGQYEPTWNGAMEKVPDERTVENAKKLLETGSVLPEEVIGQNSIITGSVYDSYYDEVLDTTIYFCYR